MPSHPIFALVYDRMTAGAERAGLADERRSLLANARGKTLELGAGTGSNVAHWPAAVTELVLTEPDPHMARRLRRKLGQEPPGFDFEVVEVGAERLPFGDGEFDTVVATLVLCTVADPAAAAAEIARVLKPDGRLLALEHVRDPAGGGLAGWQDRMRRPWGWLAAGCHPNRDTRATLAAAGFDVSGLEQTSLPGLPPLVRTGIRGSATPGG